MAYFGEGDQAAVGPRARFDRAAIDPVGRRGVAAYLEVLAQLLVADGATLCEQQFDLLQDESVALDGRRMMGLLEPDAAPDVLCLDRRRESAEALAQLSDLDLEPRGKCAV